MTPSTLNLASLLFVLPLAGSAAPGDCEAPRPGIEVGAEQTLLAATHSSDWIADSDDHICGLSSLRALSYPAKVNYSKLWDATPEIKRMIREGIDPDSAEGIQLQQDATDRILKACKSVSDDQDHCSVWKAISHEDGRKIPDITKKVKATFSE